jgi:hypothetical protein
MKMRGLEIAGLESRSGLIMGDFHRWAGHEGRRVWRGALNVGFSAFHEGRGAGKTDPLGGHDLVNRKNCFRKKKSYTKRTFYYRQGSRLAVQDLVVFD